MRGDTHHLSFYSWIRPRDFAENAPGTYDERLCECSPLPHEAGNFILRFQSKFFGMLLSLASITVCRIGR